uniref:Protein kinase domain-containing protein n=1 Tax=Chrysotila carterae TaxID=13221 RepID=A0A7S4BN78_CHRCT
MSAALGGLCDARLTSDRRLAELYDRKEPMEGAFSSCEIAINRETGRRHALRVVGKTRLEMEGKAEELRAAIAAMRRLREQPADTDTEGLHASLLRLHEVLASAHRVYVLYELPDLEGAVSTDLLSLIAKEGRLKESEARRIFTKLVLAVKRAHECSVAVRNIKPDVVHVSRRTADAPWEVVLADLHYSAVADNGQHEEGVLTGLHGTPEYAAPEVVIWYWYEIGRQLEEPPPPYGIQADAWALGICLHVMLTGCFPFDVKLAEEDMLRAVNAANFSYEDKIWAKISEDALDLVQQLLERDPMNRPFMEEVLQHRFCAEAVDEAACEKEKTLQNDDYESALAALDAEASEL